MAREMSTWKRDVNVARPMLSGKMIFSLFLPLLFHLSVLSVPPTKEDPHPCHLANQTMLMYW
jgi:hypothetical protein